MIEYETKVQTKLYKVIKEKGKYLYNKRKDKKWKTK